MELDSPLPNNALERAHALHQLFLEGRVPGPFQHEVHPGLPRGSRENVLYFTLPAAVNFQRSSPALWTSALATWDDPDTSYVFFPERVCLGTPTHLQEGLLEHGLAVQTNRHPAIWMKLCDTFHRHYGDDPRLFLAEYQFDVPRVIHALQSEKKQLFPFLGGLKLSNYWLFILSEFTDLELRRTHEISIIPDTHVLRSTVELGLLSGSPSPLQVEHIWRQALKELGIPPGEMHAALWRWSRNRFSPSVSLV